MGGMMRAYPKYKDSGVGWPEEIPEHWGVKRLRFVAQLNPHTKPELITTPDAEVSFLPMEAIGEDGVINLNITRRVAEVRNGYSYFENGDVVFAKVTPCFENGKGAVMHDLVKGAGFGTTELTVLRPKNSSCAGFIKYIVQSDLFRQSGAGAMTGAGGLKRVPDEFTRNFAVAIPEHGEQQSITIFLDRETARIDALVEKKTRFIELLKEKRSALITRAVTKGLDPDVPMKDSGIEWLGEVPEGWDVRRLKDVGTLFGGAGFPLEYQDMQGEDLYFYKVGDLSLSENGKTLRDAPHSISRETAKTLRATDVPKNSIVYAKIGAALLLNRRRMTTADCCIDNNMTAYVANQRCVQPDWAFRWLSTIDFSEHVNPGAVPSLSEGYQSNLPIPVPSIAEQIAIVAFLDRETARIDALVRKTERSITLLKERRSALITAAVSGKIDVRNIDHE